MDIAYNNLSKKDQSLLEGVPTDIPSYISELNADIKRAELLISSLEGKIEYAEILQMKNYQNIKHLKKMKNFHLHNRNFLT